MQESKNYRAFFLVPPEVHLLDISGPAHIFYEAIDYGAPIQSHFLSLRDHEEETSSAGVSLAKLSKFDSFELDENDWIIIPGLDAHFLRDPEFENQNQLFFQWLNTQHQNGAKICSVCTGAYLLAQSGLLDGRQATTHWKYLSDFKMRFPKVDLQKDRLFVVEDNLYSSAGVSSGIDLSLFLLEETFGSAFASKIAKEVVVYLRRTEDDPQLSVFLQYRNHIENRVHQVQDLLSQHLDKKVRIEELAAHVSMSPRNLTRLFKKTADITIGEYLDKLRVERAIQMLLDGSKVESVSTSCGFSSPNQLRSLLKKYKSQLPSDLKITS